MLRPQKKIDFDFYAFADQFKADNPRVKFNECYYRRGRDDFAGDWILVMSFENRDINEYTVKLIMEMHTLGDYKCLTEMEDMVGNYLYENLIYDDAVTMEGCGRQYLYIVNPENATK